MKILKCKHFPIAGCCSKLLGRLANHLVQVHKLSEMERKYGLQFSKLHTTNMILVYKKGAEPNIDSEMTEIVSSKQLDDKEKAKLYNQVLQGI